MSLLVESIKVLNGRLYNLSVHQARFDHTRRALFGCATKISLSKVIRSHDIPKTDLYKCRLVYDKIIREITFQPYVFPMIKTLTLVRDDELDYSHKWVERPQLDYLFSIKKEGDDIIIVQNELVTDAFYYNLVFEKDNRFYTPATPLLKGTKRAKLIQSGKIQQCDIHVTELQNYEKVHCINAMTDLHKMTVSTNQILEEGGGDLLKK
ncbi:MAG: aminotransferase class IV [Saprospiraceae bacterium]